MVRRFHRSIYDELDELRASMDYLYQLALEPTDNPLLPQGEEPGIVCRGLHNLNAEVTVCDDEVIVTVDTIPGTGCSKISMDLTSETLLAIRFHVEEERTGTDETTAGDQRSITLEHRILLPARVMARGARLNFRHGVLDLRLCRAMPV